MAAAEHEKQLYQHLLSESQVRKEATAAAGLHEKAEHVLCLHLAHAKLPHMCRASIVGCSFQSFPKLITIIIYRCAGRC